jgi:hypothetical protein
MDHGCPGYDKVNLIVTLLYGIALLAIPEAGYFSGMVECGDERKALK